MDFIEEDIFRDDRGRLLPGHGGLKKKGASNRLQSDIRQKITEFLAAEVERLEDIYQQVSPKEKLRFIAELMSYVLPKSKTIEQVKPEDERGKPDFSQMTDDDLRQLIELQNKIIWRQE